MGNVNAAKVLLDHKAAVNNRNGEGNTPLNVAAFNGQEAVVVLLLDHKPDVNARNNLDKTPLSGAAQKGYQNIVDLLRRHGGH
jgi:ankyrin repeat protein